MKTITIIIFTVIFNACGGAKGATTSLNDKKTTIENTKENATENTTKMQEVSKATFEYSAMTRGSFYSLKINEKEVTVKENRNSKATVKPCDKEEWNTLIVLLKAVNLKTVSSLEAPTKARHYDGAAIANLTITKDGESYKTPAFDAGKPNEAVADLLNKMLTIANKKDK